MYTVRALCTLHLVMNSIYFSHLYVKKKKRFYNVISDPFIVNNSLLRSVLFGIFLFLVYFCCFSFHFLIVWLIFLLIYLFITRHTVYSSTCVCSVPSARIMIIGWKMPIFICILYLYSWQHNNIFVAM